MIIYKNFFLKNIKLKKNIKKKIKRKFLSTFIRQFNKEDIYYVSLSMVLNNQNDSNDYILFSLISFPLILNL